MSTSVVRRDRNVIMPVTGFLVLAGFTFLYVVNTRLYTWAIGLWSFNMTIHPFIDAEYVTAQVACWQQGVDVYNVNPCDPLGRLQDYSPLLLRLSFLPSGYRWAQLLGWAQDFLFVLSLGFLPAVSDRWSKLILIFAMLSPTTLFAMERGNIDVSMFIMTILGVSCLQRRFIGRVVAYIIFLFAALLKFYPLVLFAHSLEERPSLFVAITAVATGAVAAFVAIFGGELKRAIGNVPLPLTFGDGFSARQLPEGLAVVFGGGGVGAWLWLGLSLLAIVLAFRLALREEFTQQVARLDDCEMAFLTAGALLTCGCFFLAPSVGYRGILLLLALPSLMIMSEGAGRCVVRRLLRCTVAGVLLVMWNFIPLRMTSPQTALGLSLGPLPFIVLWLVREVLWWLICAVLLAVIVRFALNSRMWREVAGLVANG